MKSILKITLLFAALVITDQVFAQGCSQCKLISSHASGNGGMDEVFFGSNINYGILYLMAVPYILLLIFFRKRIVSGFRSLVRK